MQPSPSVVAAFAHGEVIPHAVRCYEVHVHARPGDVHHHGTVLADVDAHRGMHESQARVQLCDSGGTHGDLPVRVMDVRFALLA